MIRMTRRVTVGMVAAVLMAGFGLTGCGSGGGGSSPTDDAIFRGRYANGFETTSFTPCGSTENWWVEGNVEGAPYDYTPVYVELRGTPSEPGRHGHNGAYQRAFRVREVLAVRQEIPDGCR
jgi:hypothetical protein